MKRDDLIKMLLEQVPSNEEVRVENCMIHDGQLAVREEEGDSRYDPPKYYLIYGLVG